MTSDERQLVRTNETQREFARMVMGERQCEEMNENERERARLNEIERENEESVVIGELSRVKTRTNNNERK